MNVKTQNCTQPTQYQASSLIQKMWSRFKQYLKHKPLTQRQQIDRQLLEQHRKAEQLEQSRGNLEIYRMLARQIL